jgi:hypothetical protein
VCPAIHPEAIFPMNSLQKLVWAAYGVVAGLLALIILLGIRQYALSSQYTAIIVQSEKAIFHFATIRESITESLIDQRWQRLSGVVPELEKLNSELVRLQENTLIPSEFKLALVDKVDVAGIIIAVRKLMHGEGDLNQSKLVQEQMRTIADHLLQYDRIIGSQARGRLLNFQLVIIGALGLIISLAAFSLNRFYRNSVVPLLRLAQLLRSEGRLSGELDFGPEVSREIAEVIEGVKTLSVPEAGGEVPGGVNEAVNVRLAVLAETINETTNRLNGMINCAQLLADTDNPSRSSEETALLARIIDSGARIAESWKKVY